MPTIRFRLRNPRQAVKGGLFAAFAAFIEAASVMDSARASLVPPTLIAAGILALAYVFYLRPYVTLDDAGITLGNWIRTVRIPWREYKGLSSKLGLKVLSEKGDDAVASYPRSDNRRDRIARRSEEAYRRPEPALRPKADLQWATPLQARLAIDSANREAAKGEAEAFASGGGGQYSRRFCPASCFALAAGLMAIAEGVRQAVSG